MMSLVFEKIPFFLLALITGIVTMMAQSSAGTVAPIDQLPLSYRFLNAMHSVVIYIGKTIIPAGLSPFYPFPSSSNYRILPEHIVSVTFFIAIMFAVITMIRKKPMLILWFVYLASLAPVLGILQVGNQSSADRYTYVPTMSIIFLIVTGFLLLVARIAAKKDAVMIGVFPLVIIVSLFSFLNIKQQAVWKNSFALWSAAYRAYPDTSSIINTNYGVALNDRGDYANGVPLLERALQISPDNQSVLSALGFAYYNLGKNDKALLLLEKAIASNTKISAETYNNAGNVYCALGRFDEAIVVYQKALRKNPAAFQTWSNLGNAYGSLRQYDKAIANYHKAIDGRPSDYFAFNNIGNVYAEIGDYKQALASYMHALKLKPDFVEAAYNLGELYGSRGNKDEARAMFEKAIEINPRYERTYHAFVHLLRESGDEAGALELVNRAKSYGIDVK